jgi:hypothetical protein
MDLRKSLKIRGGLLKTSVPMLLSLHRSPTISKYRDAFKQRRDCKVNAKMAPYNLPVNRCSSTSARRGNQIFRVI